MRIETVVIVLWSAVGITALLVAYVFSLLHSRAAKRATRHEAFERGVRSLEAERELQPA